MSDEQFGESVQVAVDDQREELASVATAEIGNIALAPDEVATLQDLVTRYDEVLHHLDQLNQQIESLLQGEGIKACES